MREYILYMKKEENTAKAYITPCFEVDKLFWEEQNNRHLFILGKSTSLAFIFALRELANQYVEQNSFQMDSISKMRDVLQSYERDVNHLYVREAKQSKLYQVEQEPLFRFSTVDEHEGHIYEKVSSFTIVKEAKELLSLLSGRSLLFEEIEILLERKELVMKHHLLASLQWLVLLGLTEWLPGVAFELKRNWYRHRLQFRCERCGSQDSIQLTVCHSCLQGCAYCEICLDMGRSKCCTPYVCVPWAKGKKAIGASEHPNSLLEWHGTFSSLQAQAAKKARQFVCSQALKSSKPFLIWAVCGAGKTEIIFPSIEQVLLAGGKVCIATPRKDVVLELAPRLSVAFPTKKTIAIHGTSTEKWEEGDIVISTTHQLMRCYRRFQLVVVDEVDAFPFHNNLVLFRAVQRAVSIDGKLLYLSATPPAYLRKQLVTSSQGRPAMSSSTHVIVPTRYHGQPLPLPKTAIVHDLQQKIQRLKPIRVLLDFISTNIQQNRQAFIFVPRIEDIDYVLSYLQHYFSSYCDQMAGVHASDPLREEKVMLFRKKRYLLLVTTTILERGVTIPRTDCLVIGAEAHVFDEASLVQIAGRVGRSADSPDGRILFLMANRTKAPYEAVKQIKQMNALAMKKDEVTR